MKQADFKPGRGGNRGNQHTKTKEATVNLTVGKPKVTAETIAIKSGFANAQEMRDVDQIVEKGTPELVEELDKGNVPVARQGHA